MKERVLLVDRSPHADALEQSLRGLGYVVERRADGATTERRAAEDRAAQDRAAEDWPALALLEASPDGVDAAGRLGACGVPIIFVVSGEDDALIERTEAAEPFGYLVHPMEERQLALTLRAALAARRRRATRSDDTSPSRAEPATMRRAGGVAELRDVVAEHEEQRELMATVLNSISDGLIVTDREGRYLVFNSGAERLLGEPMSDTPPDERGRTYGMYLPDGKTPFPSAETPLARALRGEHTNDVEVFVRNAHQPDGISVTASGRPLRDQAGHLSGATIIFRDVTEMKRARDDLETANQLLHERTQTMEAVFEGMSDGVLLLDAEGTVLFRNGSVERMLGRGMIERVDPSRWREGHGIFFPDEVTRIPQEELPHMRAVRGEHCEDHEQFIRNPKIPNGVHLSVDARPMYDPSGAQSGVVLVARDITHHHRVQQALTDAFAHGRLEVLDTIVHNVGNAINSVLIGVTSVREEVRDNVLLRRLSALAEAIEARDDDWGEFVTKDPQGRQVLPFVVALARDFEAQNAQLGRIIERVAARVRHIAEILRTQPAHFDGTLGRADIVLEKALDDAAGILRESLARRGVALHVRCATAPREIRVQESKFQQLIVNLVKNAMDAIEELREKRAATEAGKIGIDAYLEGDSLVIDVSDDGIGIDPADFRSIFFPGYTTKEDGTGLGLHSAANYVIGSGGTIRPLSDGVGHGATLRVAWKVATIVPPKPERAGAGVAGREAGAGA